MYAVDRKTLRFAVAPEHTGRPKGLDDPDAPALPKVDIKGAVEAIQAVPGLLCALVPDGVPAADAASRARAARPRPVPIRSRGAFSLYPR